MHFVKLGTENYSDRRTWYVSGTSLMKKKKKPAHADDDNVRMFHSFVMTLENQGLELDILMFDHYHRYLGVLERIVINMSAIYGICASCGYKNVGIFDQA